MIPFVSATLANRLLQALDGSGQASLRGQTDLEPALQTAWAQARRAWPDVELPAEAFLVAIADRLDPPTVAALAAMHTSDLYVATACATGNARAIEHVTRQMLAPAVAAALRDDAAVDDLLQQLTVRFFVDAHGAPGRIVQYAGRGSLGAWIRVAVLRAVKDMRRGLARAPRRDELIDDLLAEPHGSDPEIDEIRTQCRDEFRVAFETAVDALGPDDRRILRLHHLRGVTLDQLAKIEGVHRVTAARRLARARRQLLDTTKAELAQRLRATGRDIESVLGVVASRLEVSVDRLLATRDE